MPYDSLITIAVLVVVVIVLIGSAVKGQYDGTSS